MIPTRGPDRRKELEAKELKMRHSVNPELVQQHQRTPPSAERTSAFLFVIGCLGGRKELFAWEKSAVLAVFLDANKTPDLDRGSASVGESLKLVFAHNHSWPRHGIKSRFYFSHGRSFEAFDF
mmetsp:Transcript_51352/g.116783  ORF Transcript_51352/g.116783 Transcript_51352/m.116783 type:complete len:123 (-) Transcript_51352:194-562(-)